ncbi:MAG: peptidase T [Kiritimatiellae bacterium]|nr:peptidase T [Kiritimatiellia bacterium]
MLSRFLTYVAFDTQSSEGSTALPSTPGQTILAKHLAQELTDLGAHDVYLSPDAYVYATIPASPDRAHEPALGFLAHMDTSPDASGAHVKPTRVTYTGGILPLGTSGRVLDPAVFPELNRLIGKDLIVTDGTTLLGADDKIGLAICVSLAETLLKGDAPSHPEIRLCFTPDEEIGEGTRGFDPVRFGAKRAYTIDGGDVAEVENANFNAAHAVFDVTGVSVHPGTAKSVMVNALKVAGEILTALPADEAPEHTEGREGFFHPTHIEGTVGHARLELLVRDHDAARFAARKEFLTALASRISARYPTATPTPTIEDQYFNMEEGIAKCPSLIDNAVAAIRAVGLEPKIVPIRGGTDGAALTRMGIPCPNLGTGGRNYHGECEYAIVEEMQQAFQIVLHLAVNG